MKVYDFIFVSPTRQGEYPRRITRKCKNDCSAIAWVMQEYGKESVDDITLYDDDNIRTIKIWCNEKV